jgi:putative spermidine/putrescine transport system ATP-binding protein
MTVSQNVGFGPEVQGLPKGEREKRVEEALSLVRMNDLASRYPHEISGGQQQRVALARALAVRPRVLLLDEPLSNLDARLRDEIRHELKDLHRKLHVTMIYVTHDQEDALTLATKIALLRLGGVEQVGTPLELYQAPHTRYVAEFLGSANILPCSDLKRTNGSAEISLSCAPGERLTARYPNAGAGTGHVLCLRPEQLSLSKGHRSGTSRIAATVRHIAFKGSHIDIECETTTGERVLSRAPTTSHIHGLTEGDLVFLSWPHEAAVVVNETA